jgi:hypothetical protein
MLLIFGGIFTVIFFNTNPYTSGFLTHFSFFLSFLLAIFSAISLAGVIIMQAKKMPFSKLRFLRRSLLTAFALTGLVVFSSLKVLNAMSVIAFLLTIVLLEFFFASKRIERALK